MWLEFETPGWPFLRSSNVICIFKVTQVPWLALLWAYRKVMDYFREAGRTGP